ncbi:MAG TPA: hypothetical protein VNY78_07035 [Edaphobacter sp.]|jgi:hypothetical protein|nr:hypothetical protein [Edaphobacter sp.]
MLQTKLAVVLILLLLLASSLPSHAQTTFNLFEAATAPAMRIEDLPKPSHLGKNSTDPPKQPGTKPFSKVALGFRASTLGTGLELATPLWHDLNLRLGANIFAFGCGFNIDGVHYDSDLHFRSAQASLDWFPNWFPSHSTFHISPGVLYGRNSLSAIATIPPGQSFTLGDQPLINSIDDPMGGTASVVYPRKFAPTLMAGFSNMISRTGSSHLSFPLEFGMAFTGRPLIDLHLSGTACTTDGCFYSVTDPTTQIELKKEIVKLNNDVRWLPVYPIVSAGVIYRF